MRSAASLTKRTRPVSASASHTIAVSPRTRLSNRRPEWSAAASASARLRSVSLKRWAFSSASAA